MTGLTGSRVLVTGADGFIGSHLAERLLREAADVRALACYNPEGSFGWLDAIPQDHRGAMDIRLGDIRDPRFMGDVCTGVDVVYHLAALISIPYSYQAPFAYFDVNLTGTLTVLEAALRAGVTRLVHTSTSEVYGSPDVLPIVESHPLQGQSPYSASKIAADMAAQAWHRSFGLPVVTLRPFNTYGPRQSTRAVIPALLTQLLDGGDVRLGDLRPRRDFTYVSDTVEAFIRMVTREVPSGETVHLGSGSSVSIGELAQLAADAIPSPLHLVEDARRIRPPASEVWHLLSDPGKASRLLDWQASVPLTTGLQLTADWLRADGPRRGRFHV
ncbi:MAG: GDP-mannose 4,6-dehydratase [Actinomycetota bacterium]|nr:GDP-mannose 4,6-dehydratase [Actinomycetota bacterium]